MRTTGLTPVLLAPGVTSAAAAAAACNITVVAERGGTMQTNCIRRKVSRMVSVFTGASSIRNRKRRAPLHSPPTSKWTKKDAKKKGKALTAASSSVAMNLVLTTTFGPGPGPPLLASVAQRLATERRTAFVAGKSSISNTHNARSTSVSTRPTTQPRFFVAAPVPSSFVELSSGFAGVGTGVDTGVGGFVGAGVGGTDAGIGVVKIVCGTGVGTGVVG